MAKLQHVESSHRQQLPIRTKVQRGNRVVITHAGIDVSPLRVPNLVPTVLTTRRQHVRIVGPRYTQHQPIVRPPLGQLAVRGQRLNGHKRTLTVRNSGRIRCPPSAPNLPLVLNHRRTQHSRSRPNLNDPILTSRQQPRPIRTPSPRHNRTTVRRHVPFNAGTLVQNYEPAVTAANQQRIAALATSSPAGTRYGRPFRQQPVQIRRSKVIGQLGDLHKLPIR